MANETVLLSRKRCHGRLSEAQEALLGRYIDFLKECAEHLHLRHHLQGSSLQTPEALVEPHTTPNTRSSSSSASSSSVHRKSRRTKRLFHDRACNHCHTHFTSQWRAGPMGPSSLCNACGLRYARRDRHHSATEALPAMPMPMTTANTTPSSPPQQQQPGCTAAHPETSRPHRASLSYLLN